MSQALYTSKTGISAGQTQIDVIANNVANINTTAYKTANVTFSTLFSKTISSGSAATTKGGGTNPKQIGLGTQVASISRNFESGSFQQTGVDSDLMISGNGYFVVQDGGGTQYLTRDGHFSLDSDGNLVTAAGYKVVGTTNEYSTFSSDQTIKVPTMLNVTVSGTSSLEIADKPLNEMNAVTLNTGRIKLNVGGTTTSADFGDFAKVNDDEWTYTPPGGGADVTYERMDMAHLSTADRTAMTQLFGTLDSTDTYFKGTDGTYIRGEFPAAGSVTIRNTQRYVYYDISDGDLQSTLQDFETSINNAFSTQLTNLGFAADKKITFSIIDGGLQVVNDTGVGISVADDQTSNFLVQTGLAEAIDSALANQNIYYSNDMNQSAIIGNSYNSASAIKRSDWVISESGIITAKYNDGSQLTVSVGNGGMARWEYTTANNVVISGSGAAGSDLDLSATDLNPANMVLQLGTVVNDSGLIAEVDNMWTIGPNAGEFAYGMSNGNGFGLLKSGGLEASNVDMATELSNMIVAQRAIQVNSRVFSTASSILETLAYLGQ